MGRALSIQAAAVLAGGCLGLAGHSAAAPAPGGPHDPTGIWSLDEPRIVPFGYNGITGKVDENPPLTPTYDKEYKARQAAVAAGRPPKDSGAQCLPNGMPRMMRDRSIYPIEFVMTPEVVYTLHTYQRQVRRIYVDGRKHPAPDDIDPSYSGHSVGHWEGDTLVVDTIGVKAGWYDQGGLPHSDKVHTTERIRRLDAKTLEDRITVVDPEALTGPWSVVKRYKLEPKGVEMMEYVCEENNRNTVGADGAVGAAIR